MNILFRMLCAVILFFVFGKTDFIFAADGGSQIVGSQIQQDLTAQKERKIENKIYQQPKESNSSNNTQEENNAASNTNNSRKFLIKRIDVQGATIPTNIEIYAVIVPYQGTMMTLADAQKVADLITDIYRKKGFITSRAYVPPQTIKDNVLTIKVIEGRLGTIDVKGNRYFSTALLKKELHVTKDGFFDYASLQKSLVFINQSPDRVASTVLVPGQAPGTTDVVMNVKDRLPIHVGFIYDNYGSRYIDSNRYALTLEDNNLLGFDDRMFAKVQTSDNNYMRFGQLQYVVPITETLNIGAYGLYSHFKLTKDFAALDSTGTAKILGLFFDQALVQEPGFEWRLNGGFDYKNISNDDLGVLISRDKERVFKLGTEWDITDPLGRTIISPELDVGAPDFLGGMSAKDPLASRLGSGGAFQKEDMTLYRLQPLPFATSLLWKNSGQWSHETLPAAEEFQLGGADSVRGYGPDAYSSDKGLYSALEWSIPFYFIPDSMGVPFTHEESLKDALRFVTFYDYGFGHLNSAAVGEEKNISLQSLGYGLRLNVRDNVTCRVELGYPIGQSANTSSPHVWVETTVKY